MSKGEDEKHGPMPKLVDRRKTLGLPLENLILSQPIKAQGELTEEALARVGAGETREDILNDMLERFAVHKRGTPIGNVFRQAAKYLESGNWPPRRGKPRSRQYRPTNQQDLWIDAAVDWAAQSGCTAQEAARQMRMEIRKSAKSGQPPAAEPFKDCSMLKSHSDSVLDRMTAEVKKRIP